MILNFVQVNCQINYLGFHRLGSIKLSLLPFFFNCLLTQLIRTGIVKKNVPCPM